MFTALPDPDPDRMIAATEIGRLCDLARIDALDRLADRLAGMGLEEAALVSASEAAVVHRGLEVDASGPLVIIRMAGERYGSWLVIADLGHGRVEVRCDCGRTVQRCGYSIRAGRSTQCASCATRPKKAKQRDLKRPRRAKVRQACDRQSSLFGEAV